VLSTLRARYLAELRVWRGQPPHFGGSGGISRRYVFGRPRTNKRTYLVGDIRSRKSRRHSTATYVPHEGIASNRGSDRRAHPAGSRGFRLQNCWLFVFFCVCLIPLQSVIPFCHLFLIACVYFFVIRLCIIFVCSD